MAILVVSDLFFTYDDLLLLHVLRLVHDFAPAWRLAQLVTSEA